MSMKTILVPMEPHEGMSAVLETALLLAKKRGSYIEGFPLRFGISEFVAVDPAGSIPLESYRQESAEEAAQGNVPGFTAWVAHYPADHLTIALTATGGSVSVPADSIARIVLGLPVIPIKDLAVSPAARSPCGPARVTVPAGG